MLPPWPQRNGYADADGDDNEHSDCETDEEAAHCLSFPRNVLFFLLEANHNR